MSDFGDIERADTFDADPTIASEQVAMRLHKLRGVVEFIEGRTIDVWRDLSDDERAHVVAGGAAVAEHVGEREPDNPAILAEFVHSVRVDREGGRRWGELSPDERQIAIDLLDLILDWLEKEGRR